MVQGPLRGSRGGFARERGGSASSPNDKLEECLSSRREARFAGPLSARYHDTNHDHALVSVRDRVTRIIVIILQQLPDVKHGVCIDMFRRNQSVCSIHPIVDRIPIGDRIEWIH